MHHSRKSLSGYGLIVASLMIWASPGVMSQVGDWELPCGLECFEEAAAASAQCREEGGSFWECLQAASEALEACRQEAGCEEPDHPEPCGLECFGSAREASAECREDGGSFWECLSAYRDAVVACREEAGCQVPDHPEPCGLECFESAREAFGACREDEGSFVECAEAFLAELGACREEAGCKQAEEEEEQLAIAPLVGSGVEFTRGDVNRDGGVDLSDPIALLNSLFLGTGSPDCLDAADANDDGVLDVSDPAAILNMLFLGRGPLPEPSILLGIDPTPDELDCVEF